MWNLLTKHGKTWRWQHIWLYVKMASSTSDLRAGSSLNKSELVKKKKTVEHSPCFSGCSGITRRMPETKPNCSESVPATSCGWLSCTVKYCPFMAWRCSSKSLILEFWKGVFLSDKSTNHNTVKALDPCAVSLRVVISLKSWQYPSLTLQLLQ